MRTLIFSDFFDGTSLDLNKWNLTEGNGSFIGRTQYRATSAVSTILVDNGSINLPLDTYNPTAMTPGDSFYGTDIFTEQLFEPRPDLDTGISVEARVRVRQPISNGIVAGFFSFITNDTNTARDETTFELLSNSLNRGGNRIFTNAFNDRDFNHPGDKLNVLAPDLFKLNQFNTIRFDWFGDVIRYWVNGQIIREELVEIPSACLRVCVW